MEKKIGIEILYYFLACNHSIHNGFPLRKRSFSETRALINDLTTAVDRAEGRYAIEKRNFTKTSSSSCSSSSSSLSMDFHCQVPEPDARPFLPPFVNLKTRPSLEKFRKVSSFLLPTPHLFRFRVCIERRKYGRV